MTIGSGSPENPPDKKFQLSPAQIVSSAAAAVSAAIVASFFGVAGTIIGAALTSVVATVGTALYTHSLRVTQDRVRDRLQRAATEAPPAGTQDAHPPDMSAVLDTAVDEARHDPRRLPWRTIVVGTALVFVVALGALSVIEGLAGGSVSALLGRDDDQERRRTTVGEVFNVGPPAARSSPSPTPSPTSVPTTESPDTATESPSPSESPTPTRSTPTPSPSPTAEPTEPRTRTESPRRTESPASPTASPS